MACGGCAKRKAERKMKQTGIYDVMGGHRHLPNRQLKARLEEFKRRHCKECEKRYKCDYGLYANCTVRPK